MLNDDLTEKTDLLATLVCPWPVRVAGSSVSSDFDAATSAFTLRYVPDPNITAPTIVAVPGRAYPHGYLVTCGDCVTEISSGELRIVRPPTENPAVMTLRPASP